MNGTVFIVLGLVAIAGGVVLFATFGRLLAGFDRKNGAQAWRLGATMLLALGVLVLVTGWLLTGENPSRPDALRTGGLAAGSVVALYALWLNDRRRRVEERRQEIERGLYQLQTERAELDRERADDERFARAVELLGSDADQVRVGALHALAGLARSRPDYTQTVLDVMCAYLRRPFDRPGEGGAVDLLVFEREQQVRFAVQRLIADLLPAVGTADAPRYDLDLHGATLEYFDISHRVLGQLRIREARFYESNSFHHCEVHGAVWFTNGVSRGRLYLHDTEFYDRCWFSRFAAHDLVDFARSRFHGDSKFAGSTWHGPVSFEYALFRDRTVDFARSRFHDDLDLRVFGGLIASTLGMTVSTTHDVRLPAGWHLDPARDDETALVRA